MDGPRQQSFTPSIAWQLLTLPWLTEKEDTICLEDYQVVQFIQFILRFRTFEPESPNLKLHTNLDLFDVHMCSRTQLHNNTTRVKAPRPVTCHGQRRFRW